VKKRRIEVSSRQRISIIVLGVIISTVIGLIFKDTYNCMLTGVIVSSSIAVFLNKQDKKEKTR
jgi:hypothetical protein